MLRTIKYFIILIALIAYSTNIYANSLRLDSISVNRGDIFDYSIKTDISFTKAKKVRAYFTYNASLIEFKEAKSAGVMACKNINVITNDVTSSNIGYLTIACDSVSSGDTLVKFSLKALVSQDSIADFTCDSLYIDDLKVEDLQSNVGKIKVIGDAIYLTYPEGINSIYPNPVELSDWGTSRISYNLRKDYSIKFLLYNVGGSLIASKELLGLKGSNSIDLKTILNENGKDYREFSAGNYIIILETPNGTYNKNFIYLK